MGFFSKKKATDGPSSILSESEIRKKLYGEFSEGVTHVVIGEREHFKESLSSPVLPRESSPERDSNYDLFSAQRDALAKLNSSSHEVSSEPKPADHASRYVPLHDFEKRTVASVSESSNPDVAARFRYNRPQENKLTMIVDFVRRLSEKTGELAKFFSDPQQVTLRRFFYWGGAVLVVSLLFLGVNALNTQREEAMRGRYKIPGRTIPERTSDAVAVVVPSKPVAERPVVITPAPVRPKKVSAPETSSATVSPLSVSYVIQVVTYPTKQDADHIVDAFRRAGLRAYVKENARPSGRLFYLVLLGGFRTEAEAQAQLLKFRAKEVARPFQDAFVKSSRS